MKLKMFKPYKYSILVEAVKKISINLLMDATEDCEIGVSLLIFRNSQSQDSRIITFLLIGRMDGEGLYRLVYSDFHA